MTARLTDRLSASVQSRTAEADFDAEAGMTTAEYAVGTIAAVAFAAVLLHVVNSGGVLGLVTKLISKALSSVFSL